MGRTVFVALALVLGGAAAAARGDRREPQHLTVVVTDRHGQPVQRLSPHDIEIRVDGVPRQALSAEPRIVPRFTADPIGSIGTRADEATAAREPGVRTFAFYLDEAGVEPGLPASRVRAAVDDFIDQKVHDRDLTLAIRSRDGAERVRFRRDRAWAHGTVAAFEGRRGQLAPSTATLRALTYRLRELAAQRAVLVIASESGDAGLEEIARLAADGRVTVYTFDPSTEVRSSERRWLAARTGGLAIDAETSIAGFARIAHDTEAWWTLTFDPGPVENRFHTLDVTSRRGDIRLRAAMGFWPAPLDRDAAADAGKDAAPIGPPRWLRTSAMVETRVGLIREPSGMATIVVTWEPARSTSSRAAWVTATARTSSGTVLAQTTIAGVGRAVPGIADSARVGAPVGTVAIDLIVLDEQGRTLDTEARDVDVPDFTAAHAAGALLLPIEIVRTDAGQEAPAAARLFRRVDRLRIRVPTTADDVGVTARLLDGSGHIIRTLEEAAGARRATAEFPLALLSLAPAQYHVEAIARTSDGRAHVERVAFRIED